MPLTDQDRIARDATRPRIVELWFALQPLRSVVRFMQSGAHPDDETSAMLAALGFRDGLDLSYACANRGEGGQNDIGREATEDLGTLRTAEMEQAARALNLRLYWLSETPQDAIFDFGFSKSGVETVAKWGRDRTLKRFVDIVRTERPDILCPTFLDIPGQHGHHRAMTQAAHDVMDAAADPGFAGSELAPWQVAKLYLPAWSGAGGSYDDEEPPPPATVTVEGAGRDPVTGWSYARIGQQSRAFHRTQGMGRWVPPGAERDWPLHLVRSEVGPDGNDVTHGLPGALADLDGTPALARADGHIAEALAAFPDTYGVLGPASAALKELRAAREGARPAIAHRLDAKIAQLSRVIRIAAEVEATGRLDRDWLRPGDSAGMSVESWGGNASAVSVAPVLPPGWSGGGRITVAQDAPPSDPYPAAYDPLKPPAPALAIRVEALGMTSETLLPLEVPPVVLPARSAGLSPTAAVLNLATGNRTLKVAVTDIAPRGAAPSIDLPRGWTAVQDGGSFTLTAPAAQPAGLTDLPLLLDGLPAMTTRRIAYPHVPPRARSFAASLKVLAVEVALPQARIGYVGAGNDNVAHWLAAIGCDMRVLTDADLADGAALSGLDSLVVGVFAYRFRPALAAAWPAVRDWVEAGGNLVTLYHRPWDHWDPDAVPPKRLVIGQPSLRWRVTDEAAAVRHLDPDAQLLNTPNRIGAADWAGWHKERGLYFAAEWDPAYAPLLEMADPGEKPHRGALLTARVGRGRHTHVALILHHQMEKLVPGAFRLMANLVAPPE